ncbi:MAG: AMP nucleosidase, partial [Microbacteriaceae bacterium]|nr:AMP nucleosidase [Burkholderiaceae bacterium]
MTSPTLIVTQRFTDADAALAHAATIYNSGIAHLRQSLQDFVAGTTPSGRIRACYPIVRVRTNTVARADSRLSYGFVAGPGVYETTLTRPDLFANYFREQFDLLLRNHGGAIEVGMSRQPIPIHFSFAQHDHVEGTMSAERRQLMRDVFDLPDLAAMDDGIANG